MARTLSKDEIREIPVPQRLELIEELWESIVESKQELPVPDWHRRLLDEAIEEYERDPDEGQPWEQVRDEIFRKK